MDFPKLRFRFILSPLLSPLFLNEFDCETFDGTQTLGLSSRKMFENMLLGA
jgi:hypothetical protein